MLFGASVPPQAGPGPHVYHREDEAFHVLEGDIEMLDGLRTFVAGAGSFVFLPRGVVHGFKNVGAETIRMLITATPAGLEKLFEEAGQPAREVETTSLPGPEEI